MRSARQIAVTVGALALAAEGLFALRWSRTPKDVQVVELAATTLVDENAATLDPIAPELTEPGSPANPLRTSVPPSQLPPSSVQSSIVPRRSTTALSTIPSSEPTGPASVSTAGPASPANDPRTTTGPPRVARGPWIFGAIVNKGAPDGFGSTLAAAAMKSFRSTSRARIVVETCDGAGTVAGASACAQRFVERHVDGVLATFEPGVNEVLQELGPAGIAYVGVLAETQAELVGPTSVQLSTGLFGSVVGPVAWARTQPSPRRLVLAHRAAQKDAAAFVARAAGFAGVEYIDLLLGDDGTIPADATASSPNDAVVALLTPTQCLTDAPALAGRAPVLFLPVACVDARYRPPGVDFYVASPFTLVDDRPVAAAAGAVLAENITAILRGKPTDTALLHLLRSSAGEGIRLPPFNCAKPPRPAHRAMCADGLTIVRVGGSPATFRSVGGWIPVDLALSETERVTTRDSSP